MDEPVPDTPPSAAISSEDVAPKELSDNEPVKDNSPSSAQSIDDAGPKESSENETVKETPPSDSKSSEDAVSAESAEDKKQSKTSSVLPPVAKARHDWYQTASDVYVSVMVKGVKKEDVSVEFTPNTLSVSVGMSSGSEYCMELDLAHTIVPAKSSYKVLRTKVEIKMRKEESLQWSALEGAEQNSHVKQLMATTEAAAAAAVGNSKSRVHKYPTSSHYTHNWDKMVSEIKKEEAEEKPEGDAGLNKFFQQLYAGADESVKRAMNKSFVESGGTVLSTNWQEVGGKKVEMKPPDGMEWKKYET